MVDLSKPVESIFILETIAVILLLTAVGIYLVKTKAK
jgi:hypothetical protein